MASLRRWRLEQPVLCFRSGVVVSLLSRSFQFLRQREDETRVQEQEQEQESGSRGSRGQVEAHMQVAEDGSVTLWTAYSVESVAVCHLERCRMMFIRVE